MNKKKLIIIISILIIITLFLTTGKSRTDIYLKDYEVSTDGKTMTLNVGVSSSAGYIRKVKKVTKNMSYYLTFYQTFGINSKLGSIDTFEIEFDSSIKEIYFYIGENKYKKVLEKNEFGEWLKIGETT